MEHKSTLPHPGKHLCVHNAQHRCPFGPKCPTDIVRGMRGKCLNACIVTQRSKGEHVLLLLREEGHESTKKLSGGGIRQRGGKIRTPSCVPTRTADKMHHVHRQGRITSRDSAWGILLSPAGLSTGWKQQMEAPNGNNRETLPEVGPVCQFTGRGVGGKTRDLAPYVPIPSRGPKCSPFFSGLGVQ